MTHNTQNPFPEDKRQPVLKPKATDEGKPISPGVNQPHNAKKEALGRNTSR